MENTISQWRDLDDLVFEQRNRAYGAYILRKNYGNNVRKAAYVGLAVFLLVLISPKILASLKGNNLAFDNGEVNIMPPPPVKETKKIFIPPPPPPKPELPKPIKTIAFTPPKVTNNEEIIEPEMPKMDEITAAVSTKTQEGENINLPPVTAVVPPPPDPEEVKKVDVEDNTIHDIITVQQLPEFKNGLAAMYQFLSKNIVYPAVARENGIDGTVYVGFVVWKDGSIRDVHIKRPVAGGCSEEALRVVKLMPNWNPGKQNGKAVSVTFTIPVKFKLD